MMFNAVQLAIGQKLPWSLKNNYLPFATKVNQLYHAVSWADNETGKLNRTSRQFTAFVAWVLLNMILIRAGLVSSGWEFAPLWPETVTNAWKWCFSGTGSDIPCPYSYHIWQQRFSNRTKRSVKIFCWLHAKYFSVVPALNLWILVDPQCLF